LSTGETAQPVVGLHPPPDSEDEFRQFASQVAQSAHITAILGR
jgi:hypothetical protein